MNEAKKREAVQRLLALIEGPLKMKHTLGYWSQWQSKMKILGLMLG